MTEQGVDYSFLPGEESNPLMESTLHVDWGLVLLNSARHTRAGTDDLVTGNVAFAPGDGGSRTAPDIMVIPGRKGENFGCYEPGPDDPLPSACVEILSPSNTARDIRARATRLLRLGVSEVYVLDPRRDSVVRAELDDAGEMVESSAVGAHSEALSLSFVRIDGRLAVCCPAGRIVSPGDDPFGWLASETARADAESYRADMETARADDAARRADEALRHADEALQQAGEAEARAAAAEAELAELRRRLAGDS